MYLVMGQGGHWTPGQTWWDPGSGSVWVTLVQALPLSQPESTPAEWTPTPALLPAERALQTPCSSSLRGPVAAAWPAQASHFGGLLPRPQQM